MGAYAEYLNTLKNWDEISKHRKKMLSKISKLRDGRDILVFATDLSEQGAPIAIDYTDLLAVQDQLENMSGNAVDVVLETPGGFAEVVEDIVHLIRKKYDKVGMIIPGYAKSAGTILAMAGDEILMGDGSALGPIDGQLELAHGKRFSADAFLEGLKKIKEEAENAQRLSQAYIPILQNISPGEIQNCENIQCFSKHLATEWLAKYKFKNWLKHSNGDPVTDDEKLVRAEEIAAKLCSQSRWLTHGRSIKIDDLEELRIKIIDYSKISELNYAITRYYTLLRMSFETSSVYKIFETPDSQIYRFVTNVQPATVPHDSGCVVAEHSCPKCGNKIKIQLNLKANMGLKEGVIAYPVSTDLITCTKCGEEMILSRLRQRIESEFGGKVVE